MKDAKSRILAVLRQAALRGEQPNRLHIPRSLELDMCLLGPEEVGSEIARDVLTVGPRQALQTRGNTLFGMTIVWDADELKVEEVQEPERFKV